MSTKPTLKPDVENWERELMLATHDFVWKMCPNVKSEERDMVYARVYAAMYRTLALFHKDNE